MPLNALQWFKSINTSKLLLNVLNVKLEGKEDTLKLNTVKKTDVNY